MSEARQTEIPVPEPRLPEFDRPFVTAGKRVWWVPDSFCAFKQWFPMKKALLYRDEKRHGVWIPEENLTENEREMLKSNEKPSL